MEELAVADERPIRSLPRSTVPGISRLRDRDHEDVATAALYGDFGKAAGRLRGGEGIPRIVFQTWKTRQVPEHWKSSPASVKYWMQGWKHVLFSDADNRNFIKRQFREMLAWYDGLPHNIQRADVVRYAWLYVHGGVYMDLDIELQAPLDELFEGQSGETWLVKAPHNAAGHYTNFMMASTPRNPFWLHALREMRKPLPWWQAAVPHFRISYETGLGALTRATRTWPRAITVLPSHVLVPCSYCNPDACNKPLHYTKFLKGQSWCGADTAVFNAFMCNPDLVAIIVVAVLMYFLMKRVHKR